MSIASEQFLLEYIDHRLMTIGRLAFHPGGVNLPAKEPKKNSIRVNGQERESLLAMRNGADPCFRDVQTSNQREV